MTEAEAKIISEAYKELCNARSWMETIQETIDLVLKEEVGCEVFVRVRDSRGRSSETWANTSNPQSRGDVLRLLKYQLTVQGDTLLANMRKLSMLDKEFVA